MADIRISDHGSIVQFTPVTDLGRDWLEENCDIPDWARLGNTVNVDHRCAGPIIDAAIEAGLVEGI